MRVVVVLVVALAVLPLPAGAARRENPVLDAIVGTNDSFQITLNDATGAKVSSIPPGTYDVVVHDNSAVHNFHLASNEDPTVDFRTDVDFVGTKTFTVTFRPATRYAYACEPHWQVMNGSFLTERAAGPPPPPPPPPQKPRALTAIVTAGGEVTLSQKTVPAGPYRLTVKDRSKRDNFHLSGPGLDRRTGIAFEGSAKWAVKLNTGTYLYRSDRAHLKHQLRVS
jgi:Copper binding proteins, plastocyanin/azurin family